MIKHPVRLMVRVPMEQGSPRIFYVRALSPDDVASIHHWLVERGAHVRRVYDYQYSEEGELGRANGSAQDQGPEEENRTDACEVEEAYRDDTTGEDNKGGGFIAAIRNGISAIYSLFRKDPPRFQRGEGRSHLSIER